MGASKVGKTAFVNTLSRGTYPDNAYQETIGATFYKHIPQDLPGQQVKMNIWCTAGAQRFRSLLPLYTRNSQVVILMFSPDDLSSFDELRVFKQDYLDSHDSLVKPKIYLVMSKTDIAKHEWQVDIIEAQRMADEFNAKLFQISSKNNAEEQSIENLIRAIAQDIKMK